mgnify:CR=1
MRNQWLEKKRSYKGFALYAVLVWRDCRSVQQRGQNGKRRRGKKHDEASGEYSAGGTMGNASYSEAGWIIGIGRISGSYSKRTPNSTNKYLFNS